MDSQGALVGLADLATLADQETLEALEHQVYNCAYRFYQ